MFRSRNILHQLFLLHARNRAEFAAALSREQVDGGEQLLAAIEWIFPLRRLTTELEELLRHGQARGADIWHLACALWVRHELGELEFVSLDQQQCALARSVGLA